MSGREGWYITPTVPGSAYILVKRGGDGDGDDEGDDGGMGTALEEAEEEEEEAPVLVTYEEAAEAAEAAEVTGAAATIKAGAKLAGSPSSVLAPPDRFGAGAAEAAGGFALAADPNPNHCEVAGDCGDGQQIVQMVNREVAASLELAAALDEWEIVEMEQGLPTLRA